MSSTLAVTTNPTPTVGGSGHPRMPGWWWKKRKERLKRQRQTAEDAQGVQEIPTRATTGELPEDTTVIEATVAPAVQSDSEADITIGANKKKNKRKRRKNKKKIKDNNIIQPEPETIPDGPLTDFFAQYEGFIYRPSRAPTDEFRRLCQTMHWGREDLEEKEAYTDFGHAIASQFNSMYGEDVDDLSAWQKLCKAIGIDPIPDELEEAREVSLLVGG
ncbi:hypothetical protein EST38_g3732 [Candolleomyces aberdarensis]|uniref:Uncharacterized protein n=1 Tax=Candolleomyces aberdarensis TaxID=2316362 RepID=A0A4Q2DP64_9AGAR|nr:hypothetical protein EST38_g3732 [Candolleomyces aberdarensis]